MQSLSAVIITFNEEANIGRCIESAKKVADEIIVLDSFSTDNTIAIARSHGAIVYQEKFRGYIGQKNFALQLASHNYILSLDADEALDKTLVSSILEAKKKFEHRAYIMKRCTSYCGHFIRYGIWYPSKKIRLFDRRIAVWGGLNPHDMIKLQPSFKAVPLKGEILHYSYNTPDDLIWQNNRMSSIAATSLYANGKRSNWYKMLVRPAWTFINGYFFRLGFLNGGDGFTIAVNTAHQVFMKYNKLYRLQQTQQKTVSSPMIKSMVAEKKSIAGDG
jgi:glycosyltransferase involved in cell wall biosynthesis